MFFESGRNVYGDSGGATLFRCDTEDSVSLDSGDFLSLESGNGDLLLCAPTIERQRTKMTNDIFFIIICFYDGTLKGNEKLQVWVLFSKKRENEEKHGKNFSDDKLNQTNYILYICSH